MDERYCPLCQGTGQRPFALSPTGLVQVTRECQACNGSGIHPGNKDPLMRGVQESYRKVGEHQSRKTSST